MGADIFINQAFTDAINLYITNKQMPTTPVFYSFPVMVIRTLSYIYGELDIINPFRTNNENRMGGFDTNITKFGFSMKKLQDFKNCFQNYMQAESQGKQTNSYFFKIEKYLIEMFFIKKKATNLSQIQEQEFQNFIYLSTNTNQEIIQYILSREINAKELDLYFQNKYFESNHDFKILPYQKNTLIPEAYTTLGYTLDSISLMDENTLEQLNLKILNFFKIEVEDKNKMEHLKQAIAYYKRYHSAFTTGNGYVDMLLLLSVIATVLMTLFAITVKTLGG